MRGCFFDCGFRVGSELHEVLKGVNFLKDFDAVITGNFLDAIAYLSEVCSRWCFKNETFRFTIRYDGVTACSN